MEEAARPFGQMVCDVNVRPRNDASLGFHAARGYEDVGRLEHGEVKTVALMRKQLCERIGLEHLREERARALVAAGCRAPRAGGPDSTTTPSSMNTTVSATSRAKPISCVTTTIVMPVARELRIDVEHLADQLGVERRGRLVEQHQLRLHRQRAGDRDALLLAAGELRRGRRRACRRGRRARAAPAPASRASLARLALDADRRLDDVLERGHVREQVEVLEDHADLGALARDLGLAQLVQLVALLRGSRRARRRPTAGPRRSSRGG